jgi:hypothetical protein
VKRLAYQKLWREAMGTIFDMPKPGRPRIHKSNAERQRAYRLRKKVKDGRKG